MTEEKGACIGTVLKPGQIWVKRNCNCGGTHYMEIVGTETDREDPLNTLVQVFQEGLPEEMDLSVLIIQLWEGWELEKKKDP